MPIGNQKAADKFVVLATKISPEMAEVLNSICDSMHVDTYHLMQWFVQTLIRASSPQHELTPEIRKLMAMLESDAGWQHSFNIANPKGLKVAQVVLILEQQDRRGYGAVMIDKPFMGQATQTECVDDILERVTEVTMKGIYRRLRLLGADMDCQHLSDVLLTMIEDQMRMNQDSSDFQEMQGRADIAENGRPYAYGARTKIRQHRTAESVAQAMPRQKQLFTSDTEDDGAQ